MTFQFDVKSGHRSTSGVLVSSGRIRLKGGIVAPSTTTAAHMVFASNTSTSGTYSQTTTTITVTMTNTLAVGDRVWLDFTSGTASDAVYTVATASSSQFTVTAASATTSGNVTMYDVILVEADTTNATTFSFTCPGDGVLSENGLYVGLPSTVTATAFYG
jgi:hypothetical protein